MVTQRNSGERIVAAKRRARRSDSVQTQNALLESAAELLEEFGLEQISTNMIAKHAGVSPPALYHYYPNKYAVLFALAHSLLILQGNLISRWIEAGGFDWKTQDEGVAKLVDLQRQLHELARGKRGSLWIMRGMRAIPKLREVRVSARNDTVDRLVAGIMQRYPATEQARLLIPVRVLHEVIQLATELEMDEPLVDAVELRHNIATAMQAILDIVQRA